MNEVELKKLEKQVSNFLKHLLDDRAVLAAKCKGEIDVIAMGRKAILRVEVEFLE